MEFEFDTDRVYPTGQGGQRDSFKRPAKPDNWENVISLIKKARVPDNFLDAQERN